MALSTEWAGQSSADHRATVLLRHEHEALLELFRRLHDPAVEPGVTRDSLQAEIVVMLDMIVRIERDVFFPALPSQYRALVQAFTADDDGMASCAAALRRTPVSVPRQNAYGERLELMARERLAAEQTLLYNALERNHPELNRTLYDRLVAARTRIAPVPTQ